MKAGGTGERMELGGGVEPTGGARREPMTLPARPGVMAEDGTEYEVVWYPHAAASSLLPGDFSRPSTLQTIGTVRIAQEDHNKKDRWSWLG